MGFGDLKSRTGQQTLNNYLADRSYIEGYQPHQADAVVFSALVSPPPSDLCHVLRWYNHIKSYSDSERAKFPGPKKPLGAYGPAVAAASKEEDVELDEDDLFGDNDQEEEVDNVRQERLAAYAAKKATKPGPIAKSNIILDVKPWDDETDMAKLEECVRSIVADGLLWGTSKLVPVGYGIKKLQISCVVEDDKIGTDFLEEEITKFEDFVQSVDIAAFNKI
ncbi:hypothetical protein ACJMK2_023205 [Sinanodonta woodiana]|uniref:Elongation factor 1-beta n=1 Tax=Sinanodonta woodiana TaxID=1069815 RepID=A0ABD3T491_SINWO